MNFKPKLARPDKKVTSYLTKVKIHQKDFTTLNIYTPNLGAPNFIKTNVNLQINPNTIIVGDLILSFWSINRLSRQKIS